MLDRKTHTAILKIEMFFRTIIKSSRKRHVSEAAKNAHSETANVSGNSMAPAGMLFEYFRFHCKWFGQAVEKHCLSNANNTQPSTYMFQGGGGGLKV
jgi:hypothetical protein